MIDEGLTDVLRRRIIASVIDLAVVFGLTLLFARSQSERFAILDRDAQGRAVFSQADADRVEAIAREFNRTQEIGDTLYAFKAIDVLFIVIVGGLLTLLAKVLVPANTGWSLGQKIMSLRVINDELGHPTTSQHLRRTLGGIVDFFPYVIPGLVGWVMARSKPFKRRFGDTLADTAVISTRVAADSSADAVTVPTASDNAAGQSAAITAAHAPADNRLDNTLDNALDNTADIAANAGADIGRTTPPAPSQTAVPPSPTVAASPIPNVGAEAGALAGIAPSTSSPEPPSPAPATAPPIAANDSPASRLQQASERAEEGRPVAPFEPAATAPVTDDVSEIDLSEPASPLGAALARAVDPTPPAPDSPPPGSPTADSLPPEPAVADDPPTEPRSSALPSAADRTDRPMPSHRTEEERQRLFKATNDPIDLTQRADPSQEKKLPPPPRHRAVRSDWERPVAEAAPVWGPDNLSALDGPAPSGAAAEPEPAQSEPEPAQGEPESEPKEPQWSDEWDSWLYWDSAHRAWLRHDTESGRWVPID